MKFAKEATTKNGRRTWKNLRARAVRAQAEALSGESRDSYRAAGLS